MASLKINWTMYFFLYKIQVSVLLSLNKKLYDSIDLELVVNIGIAHMLK